MLRLPIFILLIMWIQPAWSAVTFSAGNSILASNASVSTSTPTDTGLAVSLSGYTGDALVVSSFSGQKSNNSDPITASYRLAYNGGVVGLSRSRIISKSSAAAGAGSSVGIASIVDATDITLQHSRIGSPSLETLAGSTLSVIPLTSGGTTLNHSSASVTTGASTSSTSFSPVATASAFTVPAVHADTSEIFIMASFQVAVSGIGLPPPGQGTWKLQVSVFGSGIWTDVGNQMQREISTDSGIATLVGLADLTTADDYEVRLVHASDGAATLSTTNVDLVAVSLSIDETSYLQSYEADTIGSTGASLSVPVDTDMQVFAATSITADSTTNATGTYLLNHNDGTTLNLMSSSTREVNNPDLGSVALSGIVSVAAADTNTLELSVNSNNLTFSSDTNFVAFGLTSVPENSSIAWVTGFFALLLVLKRRHYKRS